MQTFVFFGKYSSEAVKGMSAARTAKALGAIKRAGGEVKSMYALLGAPDLLLVVELPDTSAAVRTSLALAKLTGISFRTSPAVSVEEFDKLAAEA